MKEIVNVNNNNLAVKEYEGQRVLTAWDIARLHKVNSKTVRDNFRNNKSKLMENEDYFLIPKQDNFVSDLIASGEVTVQAINASKDILTFSESGYLMMTKPMQDELSWQVQKQLVKSYFKVQEIKQQVEENKVINFDDRLENLQLEKEGFKLAVDLLKPSKASAVKMLTDFNLSQGLSVAYLPKYIDEEIGKSATELLQKFKVSISTIKFNKLMIEHGFIVELERKARKGTKKYKSLTEKGLKYGKNVVSSRGTEKETQPLYYEDKFLELMDFLEPTKGVM